VDTVPHSGVEMSGTNAGCHDSIVGRNIPRYLPNMNSSSSSCREFVSDKLHLTCHHVLSIWLV